MKQVFELPLVGYFSPNDSMNRRSVRLFSPGWDPDWVGDNMDAPEWLPNGSVIKSPIRQTRWGFEFMIYQDIKSRSGLQ